VRLVCHAVSEYARAGLGDLSMRSASARIGAALVAAGDRGREQRQVGLIREQHTWGKRVEVLSDLIAKATYEKTSG